MSASPKGTPDLAAWIRRATAHGSGELPAFPPVAASLLELVDRPEVDLRQLEELISRDQVLAAQVLRTANSALFRGIYPIESLGPAILRLGFRETVDVALAAACRTLFGLEDRAELQVFAGTRQAIWHDSLVCAYGGRLLSRELGLGNPERVFLGATVRNLGSLLILKLLARAIVRGKLRAPPSEPELERLLADLHCELGADYLRRSRMPEYLIAATALHHAPSLPDSAAACDLHLIRLADDLCERIGVAPFARGELGATGQQSLAVLGVSPERCEYFELQFRGLAEQVRGLI